MQDNVNTCTFCLEPTDSTHDTYQPCKHRFHVACSQLWVEQGGRNTCPNCNGVVEKVDRMQTFELGRLITKNTDYYDLMPIRATGHISRLCVEGSESDCQLFLLKLVTPPVVTHWNNRYDTEQWAFNILLAVNELVGIFSHDDGNGRVYGKGLRALHGKFRTKMGQEAHKKAVAPPYNVSRADLHCLWKYIVLNNDEVKGYLIRDLTNWGYFLYMTGLAYLKL